MRLRRRIKVFVSYNHQDRALREALVRWLRRHGCEPVYDTGGQGIDPGKSLPLKVIELIQGSDAFLAVGTASSMSSLWCEKEAIYARDRRKEFLPVLCERLPPADIAPWFRGIDGNEVRYAECFDGDFAPLTHVVSELGARAPVRLSLAVLLLFLFLIGVPIFASWTIRQRIGQADRQIHDLQSWVEEINGNLTNRRKFQALCGDGSIEYKDLRTGAIVARDDHRGDRIGRRLFFRAGREVASDKIFFTQISGDTPSLSKKREIYPEGRTTGILVEEMFDSRGNLVTKRVRRSGRSGPTAYADVGLSPYPPYPIVPLCPYR